jgi:hypothetical protein
MIKFAAMNRNGAGRKEVSRGEFVIGQDKYDHWIVMETKGRCGGFFASQEEALRYAKRESNGHPELVRFVPHLLTFCLTGSKLCPTLPD